MKNKKTIRYFSFLMLFVFMLSFASAGFDFDNIKNTKDITFDGKNILGNKHSEDAKNKIRKKIIGRVV